MGFFELTRSTRFPANFYGITARCVVVDDTFPQHMTVLLLLKNDFGVSAMVYSAAWRPPPAP
jgi:hypothetical protein